MSNTISHHHNYQILNSFQQTFRRKTQPNTRPGFQDSVSLRGQQTQRSSLFYSPLPGSRLGQTSFFMGGRQPFPGGFPPNGFSFARYPFPLGGFPSGGFSSSGFPANNFPPVGFPPGAFPSGGFPPGNYPLGATLPIPGPTQNFYRPQPFYQPHFQGSFPVLGGLSTNYQNINHSNFEVLTSYQTQSPGKTNASSVSIHASELVLHNNHIYGDKDFILDRPLPLGQAVPLINGRYNRYPTNTVGSGKMNAFHISRQTKRTMSDLLGRDLRWNKPLRINSHINQRNNAFYRPQNHSINLGYTTDSQGKKQSLAEHSEVVAHEVGHAIYHTIRPAQKYSAPTHHQGGFDEAFADISSFLTMASDDKVLEMVERQTGGDLRKPNALALQGEELGQNIYGSKRQATRNFNNSFEYKPLSELKYEPGPAKTPEEQARRNREGEFGAQIHRYSNLYSGSFYDIFTDVYEAQGKGKENEKLSFKEKMKRTKDIVGQAFMRGVEYSPVGSPTTKDIALAMIRADKVENGGKLSKTMEKTFLKRKMISKEDLQKLDQELIHAKKVSKEIGPVNLSAFRGPKTESKWLEQNRDLLGLDKNTKYFPNGVTVNKNGDRILQFISEDAKIPRYKPILDQHGKMIKIVPDGSKPSRNLLGGVQIIFDKHGNIKDYQIDRTSEQDIKDSKKLNGYEDYLKYMKNQAKKTASQQQRKAG